MTGELPRAREGYEVSVEHAARSLRDREGILIDVRNDDELGVCAIEGAVHVPLHTLLEGVEVLELEMHDTIHVLCHHGVRSFHGAMLLQNEGYANARSIAGGTEAWSVYVDSSLPRYSVVNGKPVVMP